ncbi:hypothetical protein LZA78_10075 [Sinirhodobacter sp. WL0062]|uniref:Uncharacterized protein n=1 Tax=Rhodobacter flavimaris TaxID=2907145 RepID=A0ABS8YVF0_9RHOB|nr:hypothetical protein [Sinirhodobacter sp. WL0062]MCE5973827.1 hypothetical protein [Sinirhodobacter sp. WL0062]
MTSPETEDRAPAEAARPTTVTSQKPESPQPPVRASIFDTSYAPEGAELTKAWSRFDRKKQ